MLLCHGVHAGVCEPAVQGVLATSAMEVWVEAESASASLQGTYALCAVIGAYGCPLLSVGSDLPIDSAG